MTRVATIAAGRGKAFELARGATARIVSPEGSQVVDAWAFARPDMTEFLSAEHTRSTLEKLTPEAGDALFSNRRRPILTIIEDTSPGVHDLLLSACDEARYALLGVEGEHANCVANLRHALAQLGLEPPEIPSPFNIFERVSVAPGGALTIEPPVVRAGDAITLRAELDLVLVLSSCPMDIALTNGPDRRPKPIHLEIKAR